MAKTATGLPYPVPTDPIAQGADAIKALADGVDRRIQAGVLAYTTLATGLFTITFPQNFQTAPTVALTCLAGTGFSWTAQITSVSSTQINGVVWRNNVAPPAGTSLPIHWIAIGNIP